jgi:hypothetical protein
VTMRRQSRERGRRTTKASRLARPLPPHPKVTRRKQEGRVKDAKATRSTKLSLTLQHLHQAQPPTSTTRCIISNIFHTPRFTASHTTYVFHTAGHHVMNVHHPHRLQPLRLRQGRGGGSGNNTLERAGGRGAPARVWCAVKLTGRSSSNTFSKYHKFNHRQV